MHSSKHRLQRSLPLAVWGLGLCALLAAGLGLGWMAQWVSGLTAKLLWALMILAVLLLLRGLRLVYGGVLQPLAQAQQQLARLERGERGTRLADANTPRDGDGEPSVSSGHSIFCLFEEVILSIVSK